MAKFLSGKREEKSRSLDFDLEEMTLRFYTKHVNDKSLPKFHNKVIGLANKGR